MAKYEISESITGLNEGGYANSSKDKGRETYAGVARKYWPYWEGWAYVDAAKKKIGYDGHLDPVQSIKAKINALLKTPEMRKIISVFYKRNFWNINYLDLINDQQIANTVYDFSVNAGEDTAAAMMQNAVNNITKLKVLVVDGDLGVKSIAAINKYNAELLYNEFNRLRKAHYQKIAVGDQRVWLNGWLQRLKPYKK